MAPSGLKISEAMTLLIYIDPGQWNSEKKII